MDKWVLEAYLELLEMPVAVEDVVFGVQQVLLVLLENLDQQEAEVCQEPMDQLVLRGSLVTED